MLRGWPVWRVYAAQIGYKRRPGRYGGKPAVVADNTLDRQFEVDTPDRVWVTDITYIRTHEGLVVFVCRDRSVFSGVVGLVYAVARAMTTDLAASRPADGLFGGANQRAKLCAL